jgi:signal peptidase I
MAPAASSAGPGDPARRARCRREVRGRGPRRALLRAALWAVLLYVLFRHVLLVVRVDGRSMEPTFHDRSTHVAFLLRYARGEPRRGDVVVIEAGGRREMLLKRVLAVPGDRIAFRQGVLHLDGRPQAEPYVTMPSDWTTSEYRLAPGEYYVAGDNRGMPIEEHDTGIAERGRIVGGLLF